MLCAGINLPDHRDRLEDERVLVVEDEVLVSMLVEDEVRDAGATVVGPAASVADALHLIEAAAVDGGISAAVLDINLDGQHVAPVADRMAALGVPFLFATGYGEGCDTGGHGAAPLLRKPFGVEALVTAIASLAPARGRYRAAQGLFTAQPGSGRPLPANAVPRRAAQGPHTSSSVALQRMGGGCGDRLRKRPSLKPSTAKVRLPP